MQSFSNETKSSQFLTDITGVISWLTNDVIVLRHFLCVLENVAASAVDCNTLFGGRVRDAVAGVNEIKKVSNDLQTLVDCILPDGTLHLNLSQVWPVRRVHLKQPVSIQPLADENGSSRENTKIGCPEGDGVFTIW